MQTLKKQTIKWNRLCSHWLVMKIPSSEISTNLQRTPGVPTMKVTKTDTCQIEVLKAATGALRMKKTMKPKISIVHAQGHSAIQIKSSATFVMRPKLN